MTTTERLRKLEPMDELISQAAKVMGQKGGRATAAQRTPEERRAFARKGVEARLRKLRERKAAQQQAEEEALALVATGER